MKKTMISMMAVAAMLCCTFSVQAVPQLGKGSQMIATPDYAPGQAPNAGDIDEDCTGGGFPLGSLSPFQVIPADTTGMANDFLCDPACPAPCGGGCGFYGAAGADGIAAFTVPTSGLWTFATCGSGTDSSLAVREGGACPGATCVDQDDDSCDGCNAPYSASLTVNLLAGTDYYLIVDAFGGAGGPSDVTVTGPCTLPSDCDDGVFCNGAETCNGGTCAAGTFPCSGSTPFCDEVNDVCFGCNNDADCEDGIFCNGDSTCVAGACSAQSGNPCTAVQVCNETTDACDNPDPCVAWLTLGTLTGSLSVQCSNACSSDVPGTRPGNPPAGLGGGYQGDDMELSAHAGRELVSYKMLTQARNPATIGTCNNGGSGLVAVHNVGEPYSVTVELWSTASGGLCTPDAMIPGTQCTLSPGLFQPGGTAGDVVNCAPNGGLPTGVILADADDDPVTGQCGVDVYMMLQTQDGAGFSIAQAPGKLIGGPGMDDEFGQTVFVIENCDGFGVPDGTFGFGAFAAPTVSDFRQASICTVPVGPCCDGMGGCSVGSEDECNTAGGTYLGDNELGAPQTCDAPDGDGDMVRDECDGCPMDSGKVAPGQCGCGNPDTDTDADGTADCNDNCPNDPGKIEPGVCGCGTPDTDTDNDGTADCQDGCPDDPNKTDPGICGCGVAETGDSDGDGVSDCVDQCPGVDDSVFFPGCVGAIPTVSEWGMVVLALLLLAGAKVYFGRRPVQA